MPIEDSQGVDKDILEVFEILHLLDKQPDASSSWSHQPEDEAATITVTRLSNSSTPLRTGH